MDHFNHQLIADNFYHWVHALGGLSGTPVHSNDNYCFMNTGLKFPCLNYACNRDDDTGLLDESIELFKASKTPFYFCNGEKRGGKQSTEKLQRLGITSGMSLDGMVFDLSDPFSQLETAVDVEVVRVKTQEQMNDWINTSPTANGHDLESSESFFKNLLSSEDLSFYLAYVDRKPVGCGMLYTGMDGIAGNYWDAVLPEHRNKGINSLLVLTRLQHAKELGFSHLIAQCMDTSTRLYQKLGFKKVSEFEFYGVMSY